MTFFVLTVAAAVVAVLGMAFAGGWSGRLVLSGVLTTTFVTAVVARLFEAPVDGDLAPLLVLFAAALAVCGGVSRRPRSSTWSTPDARREHLSPACRRLAGSCVGAPGSGHSSGWASSSHSSRTCRRGSPSCWRSRDSADTRSCVSITTGAWPSASSSGRW